ncbi:hypothetical protein F5Y02DRAFT_429364 [Annulohypoxylon stygium]|nr:hypothetical protein F5Y02DRAFT_429364 [Annulohypoxylon stygium]
METDDDGNGNATAAETQTDSVGSQLQSAESLEKAAAEIDTNRPPHAFGVDSLVALELVHWFSSQVKTEIPVVQILSSLSIKQLGMLAVETSEYLCKT